MLKKLSALLVLLIVISSVSSTYAAQLDVSIPKNSEEFMPTYQFTRIVTIQYDVDSKLAELVGDSQQKISFDINSGNAAILIDLINSELQEKSFVKVTGISGKYSAIITPRTESLGIEYSIVLNPILQNHFIGNFATLDSQWSGFSIPEEIPIDTQYGSYDINSPKSIFAVMPPQIAEYLSGSDVVMNILKVSLIDASGISELPLSQWESLFDPTSLMSESEKYKFSGNVLTNYSMGICTIFREICQDKIFQEDFTINGEQYQIRSI
ncbi:MAG: hypothetical protein HRU07_05930 [Nitrosopumilus sp.]|nr:hypothetical protein [Nitrosopumilus sp.]NRA05685.1 hypothetical protein [Nitrosopumilus sp.]